MEFLTTGEKPEELVIAKSEKVHDPKVEGLTNMEYAKKHGLKYDKERQMFLNKQQQKQIRDWEKSQTMELNYKGEPAGFNMYKERKEFLEMLRKNNIDPVWVKNKSLIQFT